MGNWNIRLSNFQFVLAPKFFNSFPLGKCCNTLKSVIILFTLLTDSNFEQFLLNCPQVHAEDLIDANIDPSSAKYPANLKIITQKYICYMQQTGIAIIYSLAVFWFNTIYTTISYWVYTKCCVCVSFVSIVGKIKVIFSRISNRCNKMESSQRCMSHPLVAIVGFPCLAIPGG